MYVFIHISIRLQHARQRTVLRGAARCRVFLALRCVDVPDLV